VDLKSFFRLILPDEPHLRDHLLKRIKVNTVLKRIPKDIEH